MLHREGAESRDIRRGFIQHPGNIRKAALELGDHPRKLGLHLFRGGLGGVVNAANSSLIKGVEVDRAIHEAGGPEIQAACLEIVEARGELPPGQAFATPGGQLAARLVIHAVGPIWDGGTSGEDQTLACAYTSSLAVAREENARTLAFPSISTGAYGYPLDRAAAVALASVRAELEAHPGSLDEVRFVLFNQQTLDAYHYALAVLLDE